LDDFDRASEQEERDRAKALAFRKPEPIYRGHCMNCGKPLPAEVIYCDRDCLVDHERAVAARLRNGK
jgi:hypothetical protein